MTTIAIPGSKISCGMTLREIAAKYFKAREKSRPHRFASNMKNDFFIKDEEGGKAAAGLSFSKSELIIFHLLALQLVCIFHASRKRREKWKG